MSNSSVCLKAPALCLAMLGAMAIAPLTLHGQTGNKLLPEKEGFVFGIQSLDPDSPLSAADLNDHVAGSLGWVKAGKDGHLELDGRRMRFFGLNVTDIPDRQTAVDLARKLAALGVNIVRLHHIDAPWGTGLLTYTKGHKGGQPDPGRLADLDWFMYQLFQNGIYVNYNLLTGRQFTRDDGLPAAIEELTESKSGHAGGFWDPRMRQLQKDWAKILFEHVNPHTGRAWKDEPGIAVVEINNENGLLHAWLSGWLDGLPAFLASGLQGSWNQWLRQHYGSQEGMVGALGRIQALGPDLNGAPGSRWNLEQHSGAKARITNQGSQVAIRVEKPGTQPWHVQYNLTGLNLESRGLYTLSFKARGWEGAKGLDLPVGLMMSHEPWAGLGFERVLHLDRQWQEFSFLLDGIQPDANARLNFGGLGLGLGELELKDISFRPGGQDSFGSGSIDKGSLVLPQVKEPDTLPPALSRQWRRFLWEMEDGYWAEMEAFLRRELGLKSLLAGTIVGCSTPELQARFDIIDTNSYWNHPAFPGVQWDSRNWYVENSSLLRAPDRGGLAALSFDRMAGKPFSVSEYDHPWPNQFTYEMYPLLAVWAAWQDWDMIYGFSVYAEKAGRSPFIQGYFDQLGNPSKAAVLPFAARIFRQGLVAPAGQEIRLRWNRQIEVERLDRSRAWSIFGSDSGQWDPSLAWSGRLYLDPDRGLEPGSATPAGLQADVAMAAWNPKSGSLDVSAPAVVIQARSLQDFDPVELEGIRLLPGPGENRGVVVLLAKTGPQGRKGILILNLKASGNTAEALVEYSGPLKNRPGGALKNPLDLQRIRSAWLRGSQKSWALSASWNPVLLPGWKLWALDSRGQPRALAGTSLGTADAALWYWLEAPGP